MNKTAQGFTLIELMIVVAIIGILAAVAIPSYHDYVVRAQIVEGVVLIDDLKVQVKEFYKTTGEFPENNEAAGIPQPKHLLGNYVNGIELRDGAFHISFGNKVNKQIAGELLTIRPMIVTENPSSPFVWLCGNSKEVEGMNAVGENRTSLKKSFLPAYCRAL